LFNRLYELREKAKIDGEPILRDESFELLMKTVKERKPKKILEVGVNLGLSSIGMLLTSKDSTLSGIEINEEKARVASNNFKDFIICSQMVLQLRHTSYYLQMVL
jgi:predicted O-methyltransferase YrrM